MLKKISFITSVLFFLIGTAVFAHSHLEDSNPKNGEVVTTALKEIHLTFEENLENLSTLTLKSTSGTAVPFSKVGIEGNKLTGILKENLKNGTYNIHWKSVGTDGHPLEGDIPFTVQGKAATASTAVSGQEKTTTLKKTSQAATVKYTASTTLPVKSANTSSVPTFKNYIVPGSVCLLIILGVSSYWLFYRRKHI